ncbi:lytic transglycosylase domain-containing protein [Streptomyces sp. NPDC005551]|uniref:aggregation-promoting factor C-terminal-like domain-containing protein n=1 Tax=Streptomyces sp. NPDC005551 TaxID=3364725 RepID=UPI0036AC6076
MSPKQIKLVAFILIELIGIAVISLGAFFLVGSDDTPAPRPTATVTATVTRTPSSTPTRIPSATPSSTPSSTPTAKPTHSAPAPSPTVAAKKAPVTKKPTRAPATTSRSTQRPPSGSPRTYARAVLSDAQFSCLDALAVRESGWNVHATNPSSGAYGIPQALPGSKMASAGADWRTNGVTQVKWMLSYVNGRYGSACGAWNFWQSHHWY